MRLADLGEKIKQHTLQSPDLPKDVFILTVIGLVGIGAFLLGKISADEKERRAELRIVQSSPIVPPESGVGILDAGSTSTTETTPALQKSGITPAPAPVHGMYVGAISGTAYYLPWCGGVKRIKEENKVWFASKKEAEAKGYRPAANCKGI